MVEGDEDVLKIWFGYLNIIVVVWYFMILLLFFGWNWIIQKWFNQKICLVMLIFLLKDGELVVNVIKYLGLEVVCGLFMYKGKKCDKGGMKVLVEVFWIFKNGGGICIMLDGLCGLVEIV